jgi:hypothetical protein
MNHELTRRLKEWLEEDHRLAAHLGWTRSSPPSARIWPPATRANATN